MIKSWKAKKKKEKVALPLENKKKRKREANKLSHEHDTRANITLPRRSCRSPRPPAGGTSCPTPRPRKPWSTRRCSRPAGRVKNKKKTGQRKTEKEQPAGGRKHPAVRIRGWLVCCDDQRRGDLAAPTEGAGEKRRVSRPRQPPALDDQSARAVFRSRLSSFEFGPHGHGLV